MTTELPVPGVQAPEDHMTISRSFIAQARAELEGGDRLQASEKVWGAAAHALTSIAVQRGWYHDDHHTIRQIAIQLGLEFDRPDFEPKVARAEVYHSNFYANREYADAIERGIDLVEQFVSDLEAIRSSQPLPFRVKNNSERNRLQELLGRAVGADESSEDGFVNHERLERLRQRRERQGLAPSQSEEADGASAE